MGRTSWVKLKNVFVCAGLAIFFYGCATSSSAILQQAAGENEAVQPDEIGLSYRVFLLGNIGSDVSSKQSPVQELLDNQLAQAGENSAVVFLGDNIPCCSYPDSLDERRPAIEQHLKN